MSSTLKWHWTRAHTDTIFNQLCDISPRKSAQCFWHELVSTASQDSPLTVVQYSYCEVCRKTLQIISLIWTVLKQGPKVKPWLCIFTPEDSRDALALSKFMKWNKQSDNASLECLEGSYHSYLHVSFQDLFLKRHCTESIIEKLLQLKCCLNHFAGHTCSKESNHCSSCHTNTELGRRIQKVAWRREAPCPGLAKWAGL